MATIVMSGVDFDGMGIGVAPPGHVQLANAQTGNGATTNVIDRGGSVGPAAIVITTTVGGTPTCTYLIEGSADGVAFFPVLYADSATPATVVVTTFAISSATTVTKLVAVNQAARYLRVTFSANTNVTNTVDIYVW